MTKPLPPFMRAVYRNTGQWGAGPLPPPPMKTPDGRWRHVSRWDKYLEAITGSLELRFQFASQAEWATTQIRELIRSRGETRFEVQWEGRSCRITRPLLWTDSTNRRAIEDEPGQEWIDAG